MAQISTLRLQSAITTDTTDGRAPRTAPSSGRKLAIVQSNYIPWKGYFDLINTVDHFILYDDMQYTRRDWRNRNKIKTPRGPMWLTIPVEVKGKYHQKICDTIVADPGWRHKHWQTIVHNYKRAPYFASYRELFAELYLGCETNRLSQVNYRFLKGICDLLGVQTRFSWSMEYDLRGDKTERLIDLCRRTGADEYLSGPAAGAYLDAARFAREGLRLSYMDYTGYPEYRQLYPPFAHAVSIVDLIFNQGPSSTRYLKSF